MGKSKKSRNRHKGTQHKAKRKSPQTIQSKQKTAIKASSAHKQPAASARSIKANLPTGETSSAKLTPVSQTSASSTEKATSGTPSTKPAKATEQLRDLREKYQDRINLAIAKPKPVNTPIQNAPEPSTLLTQKAPQPVVRVSEPSTNLPKARPTLEDWQAKQRDIIKEEYEKKQAELKLQEVALELQAKPKKSHRKLIWAILIIILLLTASIIGIATWYFNHSAPVNQPASPIEENQSVQPLSYDQVILDKDNNPFSPRYQRGRQEDLSLFFPDLNCAEGNENCYHLQQIIIDDSEINDETYDFREAPFQVIFFATFLENLAPGEHDVEIELNNQGTNERVGFRLTIDESPTCGEGEKMDGDTCVKDPEAKKDAQRSNPTKPQTPSHDTTTTIETPVASENPTTSDPAPDRPAEEVKSAEQIACEHRIGPKAIYLAHWENGQVQVSTGHFAASSTGAAKMAWVNGICRPAVSSSSLVIDEQSALMSSDRAEIIYGAKLPNLKQNVGQDMVSWRWKNNSLTTEFLSDARVVFNY